MTDQPLPLKPCAIEKLDKRGLRNALVSAEEDRDFLKLIKIPDLKKNLAAKDEEIEAWKRVAEQARKDYEREIIERANQVRQKEAEVANVNLACDLKDFIIKTNAETVKILTEAFEKYGCHQAGCYLMEDQPCSCGYGQALDRVRGGK